MRGMDGRHAGTGSGANGRQWECWRGLGTIIDALVSAIRQERFDQLRTQFEGVSAHALGWREVRLAAGPDGHGAGGVLVRERATWDVPVPGTSAVVRCDPGFPPDGRRRGRCTHPEPAGQPRGADARSGAAAGRRAAGGEAAAVLAPRRIECRHRRRASADVCRWRGPASRCSSRARAAWARRSSPA